MQEPAPDEYDYDTDTDDIDTVESRQTANILKADAEIEPNEYAALSPETAASLRSMSLKRFDNLNPF